MKTVEDRELGHRFESDPRWQLAQRIASSRTFARSVRLSQFLLHVCDRALAGCIDEITEQQIGVHVFGRPSDYSSGEDNIVRAHARLLRNKLDAYFETEGREESLRILIPKGGYCPTFQPRVQIEAEHAFESTLPEAAIHPEVRWKKWLLVAVALTLVAAAAAYTTNRWTASPSKSETSAFWGMIFDPASPTFIVPSDTALVIYQRLAGKELTLSEYINRQFEPVQGFQSANDPGFPDSIHRSRYTNMPDMEFCWKIARAPGFALGRTTMRFARELRIGDLKGANAILIGARRANPWVELFHRGQNFQALFDPVKGADYILNRNPQKGEQATYLEHSQDGQRWSYSLVSFASGLSGQGHVLMVGGTTTAGTEGAIDFVLNDQTFGAFLKKASEGKSSVPRFEILLRTGNVAGNARQTEILSHRLTATGSAQ